MSWETDGKYQPYMSTYEAYSLEIFKKMDHLLDLQRMPDGLLETDSVEVHIENLPLTPHNVVAFPSLLLAVY